MKKLLAILLAMMLVLVSVASLATEAEGELNGEDQVEEEILATRAIPANSQVIPWASHTITITKTYKIEGDGAVNPADTLKFDAEWYKTLNATDNTYHPDPDVSIADVTFNPTSNTATATIVITLPTYEAVGEYYYTIKEKDTGVAGVTYLADTIYMKVQVYQDTDPADATKHPLNGNVKFRLGSEDAKQKITEFENKYEAGTLTVSKTVTGNFGDLDKDWNFTVVFTAPTGDTVVGNITATAVGATAPATIAGGWKDGETKTSTFVLKHGQSVKFSNIPKGVTYTVLEAEQGLDDYTTSVDNSGTAIAKIDGTTTVSGGIADHENDIVAYTNNKEVEIDTGITLETSAYVLIMALALAGFAMLVLRRREEY